MNDIGVWNISQINNREQLEDYRYLYRKYESNMKAVTWNPSKSNKTIFIMCSPKTNHKRRRLNILKSSETTLFSKFSSFFWTTPKIQVPKCVMFGPGLETPGISCIARKIVSSHSNLFEIQNRMQNSNAITIKYEGELLDISFLYSNTEALRKPLSLDQRLSCSKLFTKSANETWELIDCVKIACKNSNAFIYVIDANSEIENIDDPCPDLTLILNYKMQLQQKQSQSVEENIIDDSVCLLILACIPDDTSPRQSLYYLIHRLNLWKYNIHWQICLMTASTFSNISIGFDWMMAHIRLFNENHK